MSTTGGARHTPDRWLLAAAAFDAVAGLLHLGCIVFGPSWYLALGAGPGMARRAADGDPYAALVTLAIAGVLFGWAAYALSGAGAIRRLPLTRSALAAISAVYLLRGLGFVVLMPRFPHNSLTFWIVSSAICLAAGLLHAVGLYRISRR